MNPNECKPESDCMLCSPEQFAACRAFILRGRETTMSPAQASATLHESAKRIKEELSPTPIHRKQPKQF